MDFELKKKNNPWLMNILFSWSCINIGGCYKWLGVPCYAFKCNICTLCCKHVSMNNIFLINWWSCNAMHSFLSSLLAWWLRHEWCVETSPCFSPVGRKYNLNWTNAFIAWLHDIDTNTCISWKVMFPFEFIVW